MGALAKRIEMDLLRAREDLDRVRRALELPMHISFPCTKLLRDERVLEERVISLTNALARYTSRSASR